MKNWGRVLPVVLLSVVALAAAACNPPTTGGGGTTTVPNARPVAVAVASATSGNVPLSVAFDASGSTDSDGTIVSYSWDFGNSTAGSGVTTSANYAAAGVFTAVLTVTDDGGQTDTDSITITVTGDGDGDGYFPPSDCNDTDGAIHPGAGDPAGDDIDQNCDGIDGVQDAAIFVNAATGGNTSTCGTASEPCASIDQGQSRAIATARSSVYVAGGTYGKFTVQPGLEIRGGYGQNWQRGVLASGNAVANVTASFDATVGGPVAVLASGITTATRVADLRVTGANAPAGQASYGIVVRSSTNALVLDSLTIIGGTGGNGSQGAAGSSGSTGTAGNGNNGGNGFEPGGICNTSSAGGGGAGGSGANSGGGGGKGGVVDGSCGWTGFCSNCDAQPGQTGATGGGSGGGAGGGGGTAGQDGLPWICTWSEGSPTHGNNGAPGAPGASGAPGAGGPAGANGGTGGLGSHGAAGGGGGGGGANDCNQDDAGAGGGGGGGGGARAAVAGSGGTAGRASIALRIEGSSPVLTGLSITLGTGGAGGNGGAGAFGQPGGAGGAGGAHYDGGGR
ncbi:MAG: PKD domain-containing protein, partial [Microthrixaceae bacterium]